MSGPEFLFALELSDEHQYDAMMTELARSVFRFAGYAPQAVAELSEALSGALKDIAAAGIERCAVHFRAHDGELVIAVSGGTGSGWQTTRRLP